MINSFLKATSAGFSAKQIIDYLLRKFPHYRSIIEKSLAAGFSAEQVLKYLMGGRKEVARPEDANRTESEQTSELEKKRQREVYKNVGKGVALAGTALTGAALSRAIPQLAQQLAPELIRPDEILEAKNALPFQQKSLPGPETLGIPFQSEATPAPPTPTAPTPEVPPVAPEIPKIDSFSFIKNLGPRVEDFIKSAKDNPPENIARALELHFLSPEKKKEIRKNNISLPQVISDYLTNQTNEEKKGGKSAIIFDENKIKGAPNKISQSKAEKLVLSPDDKVGQVESIDNGIAKVNFDGQVRNRKAEELIESPLPEKELADLYDELVAKIPEHARSSNIYWAGYDENNNQFAFIPHGGALYIYENIPSDFAEKLKNAMFKAKTTGESKHGLWVAGGESRGAGLYQLIKELQGKHGGKGKEYMAKYPSIYDYFAIPREESKKKEQERKKRERNAKRKK